jgi:hypothetical protein
MSSRAAGVHVMVWHAVMDVDVGARTIAPENTRVLFFCQNLESLEGLRERLVCAMLRCSATQELQRRSLASKNKQYEAHLKNHGEVWDVEACCASYTSESQLESNTTAVSQLTSAAGRGHYGVLTYVRSCSYHLSLHSHVRLGRCDRGGVGAVSLRGNYTTVEHSSSCVMHAMTRRHAMWHDVTRRDVTRHQHATCDI